MHSTLSKTLFFTGGGGEVLDGMRSGNTLSKWDGAAYGQRAEQKGNHICFALERAIMFSDDVTDLACSAFTSRPCALSSRP